MIRFTRLLAAVFCFASLAFGSHATTISGTVNNGTTGRPAAGVDVILLNMQEGMTAVANTKTDAQGHYQLDYTPAGQVPMLVRVVNKGVNFHAMLPPGRTTADVKIYDSTSDIRTLGFPTRIIIFQPDGSNLLIGEEYEVQNQSTPPVAYFKADGNFEFKTPDGTELKQVSAVGPESTMAPVVQGTMDRGPNHYAIAFAFRPGESQVRMTYQLPYPGNKASLHIPSVYAAGRVVILAPPTVTVSAPGFQPAASQEGMSVYSRDSLSAGTDIEVSVSGTAPPPSSGTDSSGQGDPGNGGRDTGAAVTAVPNRMDSIKWILVIGFAALFFLGGAYLMRRPLPAAAPAAYSAPPPMVARPLDARNFAPGAVAPSAPAASASLGDMDRRVGASLDELKDTFFRLELRHQAGTISEQDYAEQRARAEKILRDLVRG